mmetsp:Transcript_145422/g.465968  ORF Transcript_145422/g.465968 Transcript_145422/m.465968 type:complete len:486 (+) Transcript_145422:313-1770(+)
MAALVSSALRLLLALPLMAALGEGGVITVPRMTAAGEMADIYVRTPWYFDCSHHPEWSAFRQRFVDFRMDFANAERDSEEFFEGIMGILMEANSLGRRSEATFVEWASSWGIFHLCNDSHKEEVPEELTGNFCFYGFVVVQWLGLFGQQHFGNTPGMAEWAHNARGFLNDASKFNAMHFLESSGWPVKLVELAQTLSFDFLGKEHYRPARDAALPGMALLAGGQAGSWRESPPHTQVHGATKLKAVAISYHAALVREPLSFWMRALRHRFEVEASVHILDASARTPEDIRRLHSHCKFIDGAWCVSDERLLRLNEFFESKLLSCHTGDHKTGLLSALYRDVRPGSRDASCGCFHVRRACVLLQASLALRPARHRLHLDAALGVHQLQRSCPVVPELLRDGPGPPALLLGDDPGLRGVDHLRHRHRPARDPTRRPLHRRELLARALPRGASAQDCEPFLGLRVHSQPLLQRGHAGAFGCRRSRIDE